MARRVLGINRCTTIHGRRDRPLPFVLSTLPLPSGPLSPTHSAGHHQGKGALRHVLTRSVLPLGCAPHAASGVPLPWRRPALPHASGGSEEQKQQDERQRAKP
jgi:hypothetical protein